MVLCDYRIIEVYWFIGVGLRSCIDTDSEVVLVDRLDIGLEDVYIVDRFG